MGVGHGAPAAGEVLLQRLQAAEGAVSLRRGGNIGAALAIRNMLNRDKNDKGGKSQLHQVPESVIGQERLPAAQAGFYKTAG